MTRGTMRRILRRRLNETVADLWTDTDLNELLTEALTIIQAEVMAHQPEAFMTWAKCDWVANQYLYAKPIGMFFEVEVGMLNASAVGGYQPMEKKDYPIARANVDSANPIYCHEGTHFGIYPSPATSVVGGIQIKFIQQLAMAVDTDVPELHTGLHMAVVLTANLLAIGETGDASTEIRNMLTPILARIPMVYGNKSANVNEKISLDYLAMGRS